MYKSIGQYVLYIVLGNYWNVESMNAVDEALAIAAITVILAGALGFGIYKLALPKGVPTLPIDFARKWFAWAAGIITISVLPSFFRTFSADTAIKWLIGLLFYGGLAFGAGWIYGRFFKPKAELERVVTTSTVNRRDSNLKSIYCSQCGIQVDVAAKFCWNCGVATSNPINGNEDIQVGGTDKNCS